MEDDDPYDVESLIKTAIHDTSGKLVEGAFVDRWQAAAEVTQEELLEIFEQHGLSNMDRARLAAGWRISAARDALLYLV